jgi:5'-nucleotidase
MRPLYLLCNDDGVHAPGIRALAEAVDPIAEWVIVAPHVERSGSGQAISLVQPLRFETLSPNIHAVEGTPADCVMFAVCRHLTRRPAMVLSGINRGSNIGQDTLYSGTVAAAMEACLHGIPAIALSLQGRSATALTDYADAVKVVRLLLKHPELLAPAGRGVLNVNIPARPFNDMAGFAVATLGRRRYDNQIDDRVDPRGRRYFWIGGGGDDVETIPGSDCTLLNDGYVTLTTLTPDRIDATANQALAAGLAARLSHQLTNQR